jgi:hypothetical protein
LVVVENDLVIAIAVNSKMIGAFGADMKIVFQVMRGANMTALRAFIPEPFGGLHLFGGPGIDSLFDTLEPARPGLV